MNDENFEILEAVYGDKAYYYLVEWMMARPNFVCTPAQAASEIVKEEGFEDVLEDCSAELTYYDRNSGMF